MAGTAESRRSPVRQLALIVGLFVVIVGCLIALFNVEVGVLWAVRAYVGGEGLWSKGQKDAVHHLTRYATTYDEADYRAFLGAIAVPMGDHVARVELEKPAPDFEKVRNAFIAARNHPDDADGMAQLFRRFRNVREMDQAIRIWAAGDHSIEKLVRYGAALHRAIAAPIPDTDGVRRLLYKVARVNARVTPLEDAFSRTLGAGARRVRSLSILMTLFAAAALLSFGIGASWIILRDARRSEEALRQSEARYRGLFEDAHEAVYVHDLDGRFLDLNRAAERLTGFTGAKGLLLEDLVAPEHREVARAMLERTIRDGGTGATELTIVAKDGRLVPVEVSTRAILEHERPVAVQGIARDVTERRRVEQERGVLLESERAAREAAELANRTKDQFLAMLSHELRTPLTAILTWVHLLRDTRIDTESRLHALDVIERNTRLQTTVIGDLLDVSRIVAGKVHVALAPIDAAAVVAAAVDGIRADVERRQVTLTLDLDPATPPVFADRNRLQQIVSNLLSNALKFTPTGGRVLVALARSDGDRVTLRVEDTGTGIAPEFLPHVFDPFRQADSSDTRPHGGLGLGLSIVRHLVELHGGRVEVASEGLGRGSVFRVFLLAAEARDVPELPPLPPIHAGAAPALLGGMDVLVIDDDDDTRGALGAALEERGACVRLAASATEGLAAIDERLPDVVLCDLDMPSMSGFDFMRALRERDPARGGDVPAAALTAHAREEDARRARAAGFQRHLAKPIDPLDLACTVAELVALPHLDRTA